MSRKYKKYKEEHRTAGTMLHEDYLRWEGDGQAANT